MRIILEGVDGAGKTFLANRLKQALNFEVIDKVPGRDETGLFSKWAEIFQNTNNKNCIFDRSFISEIIYRSVQKDRPSYMHLSDAVALLEIYNSSTTLILVKSYKSYERMLERGDENPFCLPHCNHKLIEQAYDRLFDIFQQCTNVKTIVYDTELSSYEYLVNLLKEEQNG